MKTSQSIDARTRMFARVIGPYLVLVMAVAIARFSDLRNLISQFTADSSLTWFGGAFVLLAGLIVIALHTSWRGAPAIIVSLMGWSTALKGLALMAFPASYFDFAKSFVDATPVWIATYVLVGVIGLYLTYVGWGSSLRMPTVHGSRSFGRLGHAT
ncbi:membrane protein [Smaragdicoccus niigatensis]|uniref:membrane protein n=1 Tax=Smaragdicoccus niigatensis TaxID=359359 RepID=UPI0003A5D72A|nr:membrane protein [Smaragdicoccus niigatensis]